MFQSSSSSSLFIQLDHGRWVKNVFGCDAATQQQQCRMSNDYNPSRFPHFTIWMKCLPACSRED
ncbi:hypothetical protein BLOT_015625 [Blomia tropicalis]|nr:hypothetical protein BLOT_015625 [Blomia tropicalis]